MLHRTEFDPRTLFGLYMQLVGVPSLEAEAEGDPGLKGKTLGLVNGSAWVQLWSWYFGRLYLPGVKLVNAGNDATQLNFMRAHHQGLSCPPAENIQQFVAFSRELVTMAGADAVMITCSTMNRSLPMVQDAMAEFKVPVVQIDQPMMEAAVQSGGKTLIVATHGPTVNSTRQLLEETAQSMGRGANLAYVGATVEEAFHLLGEGKIKEHNESIAQIIRQEAAKQKLDQVVLAQLSMSVFKFSYPDPVASFGMPVLTSGEEGFKRVREILLRG